jgi:hypothetical protein
MFILPIRYSSTKHNLLSPDYSVGIKFQYTAHKTAYLVDLDNRYVATPSSATLYYQEINFDYNNISNGVVRWVVETDSEFNSYLHSSYLHMYDSGRLISYYYFIKNVKVLRDNVLEYSLELDVLTTYLDQIYFDGDLFVERHHCNRFYPLSGKYCFNYLEAILGDELDNKFDAQSVNSSSLTYRKPIYFTGQDNLNTTINNQLWMYVWLLPTTSNKATTKIRMNPTKIDTSIDTGLQCYVAPIGNGQLINTYTIPTTYQWNARYLYDYVMRDTTINTRLVSVKISPYAPFNRYSGYQSASPQFIFKPAASNTRLDLEFEDTDSTTDYVFGNGNQYTITGSGTGSNWLPTLTPAYRFLAIGWISSTHSNTATDFLNTGNFGIGVPYDFTAPTNHMTKNFNYEPKLWMSPYYRFNYHHKFDTAKSLNPAYVRRNKISMNIIDSVLAHEQKTTIEILPETPTTSQYINEKETNRASTEVNSYEVLTASNKYAEYIANHKNHLISGIAQPVITQLGVGAGISAMTGNPMPIISAGISAGATTFSHLSKLSDLNASPDTIRNTGNNVLHDINIERANLGIRTYNTELQLREKDQVLDYYYMYGYRINMYKTWENQSAFNEKAIFTRSRFNYIKTNDNEIASKMKCYLPISMKLKQKIQQILNNGIRLINSGETATITNNNAKLVNENVESIMI